MKFNDSLNHLNNYEPGKDIEVIARERGVKEVTELASNENPSGASPKAVEVLRESVPKANFYPDDGMIELKGESVRKHNIKNENIITGAGNDQVAEFAVYSRLNLRNAFLQAGVSFATHEIYAKQHDAKCYKTQSIIHNLSEFKTLHEIHKDRIEIIFLCSSSDPLDECLDINEVSELIRGTDENYLVITDVAYNGSASFKGQNKYLKSYDFVQEFRNVLCLGIFSKPCGLSGLRIGCDITNAEIISVSYKLCAPFNANNLALKAAAAALYDEKFAKKTLENSFSRMKLYKEFAKEHHIKFAGGYTNFIIYFLERRNSTDLSEELLKKGIIVRGLKNYGLNAMKITIGTPYESERFFTEFEGILK